MIHFISEVLASWSAALADQYFVLALAGAVIFFVAALFVELRGGEKSRNVVAPGLQDFILDRLPVVNFNFIFTELMLIFIGIFVLYQLVHPTTLPFVIATISFFILIHRAFVFMTNIGPHKDFLYDYGFKSQRAHARKFQNINDFFFSGHTGLLFLMFLLTPFAPLAAVFLVGSVLMGIAVLFMHIHYSIDVFGAYFVTYSIFVLAEKIFTLF